MQDGSRSAMGGPDDRGRHSNGRQAGDAGSGTGRHGGQPGGQPDGQPDDEPTSVDGTPVGRRSRPQESRYFPNDYLNRDDDQLFEEFESDYRGGADFDTELHRGLDQDFDLDRDFDRGLDRRDLDRDLDRDDDGRSSRSRHGRGKGRRQRDAEGASFIPLFSRKAAKTTESSAALSPLTRPRATGAANTPSAARTPTPANPFGDLQIYLVPILAAVVVVMVLVVLLLNR